ncbi:peroxisomal-enoyl-isomerase [Grosmannia clavigera kw1407]|uniref:Peroxisomal-enoyl-isomerase n=1 Tax=Grosmannia clavigera (strain kw1407 / UAMH 11150) TaxID=655863 RepID=F0XUH5_GROCL|nr:peroxisomal-enoyl-isomerase [Grosmannia clavigera kw1407]EFW99032.1 peroxisomal-enoyl-isomerase [Grosmannia clavigera kw1407]
MDEDHPKVIRLSYEGRVAVITIDNPTKLNALSLFQYYDLASKMREVAARDDVYVTLLTGTGRFFSAGADVSVASSDNGSDAYAHWLRSFVAFNLNIARAFYTHPKVLVVGLNGPAVGLSAALIGFADFVYCTPETFLLTPFSSLGLVAEGGASVGLVQRLGRAKALEALLMSRRIPSDELLAAGFVNAVFSGPDTANDTAFHRRVRAEIDARLGPHLIGDSLLGIKKLVRAADDHVLDRQNVAEVFAGLDRFLTGVPQEEFRKLATGEKRHKL